MTLTWAFLLATGTVEAGCVAAPILPPTLRSWSAPQAYGRSFEIGRAYTLKLMPMGVAPSGRAVFRTHLPITVTQAGRYAVAASDKTWIAVEQARRREIASITHQHGPPCSGIRKIVVFDLQPGRYTLAFTDNPTPELRVMMTRWSK